MSAGVHAAALVGIAVLAYALVRIPRALFAEAGAAVPSQRGEWLIAVSLAAVGVAAFEFLAASEPIIRLLAAGALMVFAAVVQGDFRFLVIPELYSAVLAVAAFVGPLSLGLLEAALGGVVCGGLLALIAWLWKRRTAVEGLGFGDVKLAAAIGALLGPEKGLWAITASAAAGALLGFVLQARSRREDGPILFPYGVPLAITGAVFLVWRLR
jgi:leader peptidase (prepilin peptidase)/N-methyltransferase